MKSDLGACYVACAATVAAYGMAVEDGAPEDICYFHLTTCVSLLFSTSKNILFFIIIELLLFMFPWLFLFTQEQVEVVLHNAWITGISGDPVYAACKLCYTKIDPETGLCKRSATHGGKTERGQEAVLAHVQIAECTGVVEDVLVNAERLAVLGGLKSEGEVIAKVKADGPHSLLSWSLQHPRLGAAKFMKQRRRPGLNQTENLLTQFLKS